MEHLRAFHKQRTYALDVGSDLWPSDILLSIHSSSSGISGGLVSCHQCDWHPCRHIAVGHGYERPLQTYISRFSLLFEEDSLFSGVRYVDANIVIPGLWFVTAALLLGAAIALGNSRAGRIRNLGVAIAVPALTYLVAGGLAPFYVRTFVVRPNELVRERPYIKNNIEFTRKAFALDRIEEIPFEPRLTNAVFDPAAHPETLDNIRLWDWRALKATLQQIQEIRTYYDFPDIDVDRYLVANKQQAVMLAARELSLTKLPSGSQNWVNERA
ncbi:MAG: hypothetical protein DMG19_12860 [Acidobacteria bacterium]|nr:MAG: hypothetical protein DMG19_12860 [Acidobacteriota bacterium]